MSKDNFDAIDLRILNELTKDARISFIALAKRLHVSNTLVHQRFKKLGQSGIMKNATFRLDYYILGYETTAYTQIRLTSAKIHKEVEEKLFSIPEIVECVNISGPYALMVKIIAKNNRHLRDIIYEKILTIDGVEGSNSTFLFETAFNRSLPL